MKKVLVPVDFSACSEDALQHALQCPCNETRQLILLHVVDLFDVADLGLIGLEEYEDRLQQELVNDAENKLRDLIVRHSDTSLHLDSRVIIDRPWHGIIRTAISEDVAAIVMGSHGRGSLTETLLGSTTEKVVRKAPMTVIVHKPLAVREKLRRHWQTLGE